MIAGDGVEYAECAVGFGIPHLLLGGPVDAH